jgi:hypothetical protein
MKLDKAMHSLGGFKFLYQLREVFEFAILRHNDLHVVSIALRQVPTILPLVPHDPVTGQQQSVDEGLRLVIVGVT